PSKTSPPSPPTISAGTRGTGSPPITSGQTVTALFSSTSRRISSSRQCLPSYLTFKPAKQELTTIIAITCQTSLLGQRDVFACIRPISICICHTYNINTNVFEVKCKCIQKIKVDHFEINLLDIFPSHNQIRFAFLIR